MGFIEKIKKGLSKTKNAMKGFGNLFSGFYGVSDDFYDELEESMILADIGVETSCKAVERLRQVVKERELLSPEEVQEALREILTEMLEVGDPSLRMGTKPSRCFARRIPSVQRRRISLRSGRIGPVWTSFASMRARILRLWCLTASPLPRPEEPT